MNKTLVVVESAAKARVVQAQLGDDYEPVVVSSLPARPVYRPPADPRRRDPLTFQFTPLPPGEEFLARPEVFAPEWEILLAFDPDQRGEYWSWLLNGCLLQASSGQRAAQRLRPAGLSAGPLQAARRLTDLVDEPAARTWAIRELFDSCFAKHCRRLLGTATGPAGLPLNLTSLLPVILLAEQEKQLQASTPAPRWRVRVRAAGAGGEFDLLLAEVYGGTDEGIFHKAEQARAAVTMLRHQTLRVTSCQRRESTIAPPAPFNLPQLLAAAHRREGFSPPRTLAALQQLYQGCRVQGAESGLVSSWSAGVDSQSIAELLAAVRRRAAQRWGEDALGGTGDNQPQGGILLPLWPEWEPEQVAAELDDDQAVVYRLIFQRALAWQLAPATCQEITLEVAGGEHCRLRASGLHLLTPGFMVADPGDHQPPPLDPSPLAALQEGEELTTQRLVPEQTAEAAVEPFTLETLATELAEFSYDPATEMAAALENLLGKNYATLLADGTLRCRDNCGRLLKVLDRALPTMTGVNLLAYFEQTVEEVLSGRKTLQAALQQFDQTMLMRGQVLAKSKKPPPPVTDTGRSSSSVIKKAPPAPNSPPASVSESLAEEAAGSEGSCSLGEEAAAPAEPATAEEGKARPETVDDWSGAVNGLAATVGEVAAEEAAMAVADETAAPAVPENDVAPAALPENGSAPGKEVSVPGNDRSGADKTPAGKAFEEATPAAATDDHATRPGSAEELTSSPEEAAGAEVSPAAAMATDGEESAPDRKKVLVRRRKGSGGGGGKRKLVRVVKRK
ncbi:MAG: DNA topoisomerase [Desulfurivibrio sp.]|nr:DNA topoisomerase [Desulfurivibrio sp.]